MGKGLIGNSLSFTMKKILLGEVSYDDIEKIYAGTCFTEDKEGKAALIGGYSYYWDIVARERADAEIAQKHGFTSMDEMPEEVYSEADSEARQIKEDLKKGVAEEASSLLDRLCEDGKIVQTRYRVPEGETIIAKVFPGHETHYYGGKVSDKVQVTGNVDERNSEILCLNGEYYTHYGDNVASLGVGTSRFFNNDLELIANQIRQGWYWNDPQRNNDRLFAFKKIFPQYKDAIEQVEAEKLDDNKISALGEQGVLELLQGRLKQREEDAGVEDVGTEDVAARFHAISRRFPSGDSPSGFDSVKARERILTDLKSMELPEDYPHNPQE